MWANLSSRKRTFDDSELLILKRALLAYKQELENLGISEVKDEIRKVDSLQLRFLGIRDES